MTRALIVDDDHWQADHFRKILRAENLHVEVAAHALEAIDMLDGATFDVIILDMMMPGPNGMTLLHEMRSHTDLADIPVIVCSSSELSLDELKPYGVVAVLDKTRLLATDLTAEVKKAG